jgi:glycosyltransferase involved in cell wall biosynthesis
VRRSRRYPQAGPGVAGKLPILVPEETSVLSGGQLQPDGRLVASVPVDWTTRDLVSAADAGAAADAPRIAVVVPCFNDGPLVREAVSCLDRQEPTETVVVDDASTDEATLAVLAQLRNEGITVARHEVNQGPSAARMTGLRETTAPFVFLLDSDDLLVPGSLTPLADLLSSRPEIAVAWSDHEEFGTRSRVVSVPSRLDAYRVAYRNEYPVSSLYRRDLVERIGGWRDIDGLVGYEDWHTWMTLAERGERGLHVGSGGVSTLRRLHGTRMLSHAERNHRTLYRALRRQHPALFSEIRAHRRHSDLPLLWRWLYPVLYGGRPPLGIRSWLMRTFGRGPLNRLRSRSTRRRYSSPSR